MKREQAVALILEARRQGYNEAGLCFRSLLERATGTATIEALTAERDELQRRLKIKTDKEDFSKSQVKCALEEEEPCRQP